MKSVSIEELIYMAIAYKATNVSAIAAEIGMSRQNLHRKIADNTLRKEEICKIGKALGGKYIHYFSFPGGVVIGDKAVNKKKTKSQSLSHRHEDAKGSE